MFLVSVLCWLLVGMVVNCDAPNKVVQREFGTIVRLVENMITDLSYTLRLVSGM
jgi:hypothetical protein